MNLSYLLSNSLYLAIGASLLSIVYGLFLSLRILSYPRGDEKMNAIADAISEGAQAFIKRQYGVVAVIGALIFGVLFYFYNLQTALGFAVGAVFSAFAGIVGMNIALKSNIRTAQAAKEGLSQAFSLAFRGGAVTGFLVSGLALLSVSVFYLWLKS
jgi:K(+)-stimulated pyrophosphate-energized sodium pump